jgi:uncharacterized repeat protein (TIGR03803 family)
MYLNRFGALGALAVAALAAQAHAPTLTRPKVEAPGTQHGLARDVRVRPDGSATTSNWSGYVVDGALGSITEVRGSWIVPAVTCSGTGSSFSAFWVGIDGYLPTSGTVEQIGTDSDCASGTPKYYAWSEFYPAASVMIANFTIQPGDLISAQVRYSSGLFILTITDETTGISPTPVTGTVPTSARSSAEWIAEDPKSNGVLVPLANFGTAAYGFDNTGVADTCAATVGTNAGALGSFSIATRITMVNGGFSEAVPSPLSSDGSSFSVTTQPLTTLVTFDGSNGYAPYGSLAQGLDGNLYGTTQGGGAYNNGSVFKITTEGTPTSLYSFSGVDGIYPVAGLALTPSGNFYGTTSSSNSDEGGTVFEITPEGILTPLHVFSYDNGAYPNGANPNGGLVQGYNGSFYGTTSAGGGPEGDGSGTVFEITSGGTLTTLQSFDFTDGAIPDATLIQAADGNLYGTTSSGGTNNYGTVFEITPTGTPTTLYNFSGPDGITPSRGALVQATDGNFYGTTEGGGANGYGTVYKITSGGTLTTLYSFLNSTDGASPVGGVIQATDGNLYGTTSSGGFGGCGTIFEMTLRDPQLSTLYSFNGSDGLNPYASLTQATDGNLYGTTSGSLLGYGTVFRFDVGLGPFVEGLPAYGKAGATVKILGTNLIGATAVSLNGTAATFTVVSTSEILIKVPVGATSGKIQVVTPSGTLSSNVSFRVIS